MADQIITSFIHTRNYIISVKCNQQSRFKILLGLEEDLSGAGYNTHQSLIAIGSGGPFAQSAARALLDCTEMGAEEIVRKGLNIAGDICIYTNHNQTIEVLESE